MPGTVTDTALARHMPPEAIAVIVADWAGNALSPPKSVGQGAATSVLLAASSLRRGQAADILKTVQRPSSFRQANSARAG
jgi:hypothetical protein